MPSLDTAVRLMRSLLQAERELKADELFIGKEAVSGEFGSAQGAM